jgi:hypothetical protein
MAIKLMMTVARKSRKAMSNIDTVTRPVSSKTSKVCQIGVQPYCISSKGAVFWSEYYAEGKYSDRDYEENLTRQGLLVPDTIQFLLEWKNGSRLSPKKQVIGDALKERIDDINRFRQLSEVSDRV